jgi:hypothetical protein
LLRLGHSGIHFPQPNPGGTHELDPFKEKFQKPHRRKKKTLTTKGKKIITQRKKMSSLYVPSKHNFTSLPHPKKEKSLKNLHPDQLRQAKANPKSVKKQQSTYKLHVPKLQSIDETRQILSKFQNIQG